MPTTASTYPVACYGRPYYPKVKRLFGAANPLTGASTANAVLLDTRRYRQLRLTMDPTALAAGTTSLVIVRTGATTATATRLVVSSSWAQYLNITTATSLYGVFAGLDYFTKVIATVGAATTSSTGVLYLDAELI